MRHFEIKKCETKQWIVLFQSISFTPWKIKHGTSKSSIPKEKDPSKPPGNYVPCESSGV